MLDPRNISDVITDAHLASRSLRGSCVELIDILTRLSGADMRELSRDAPFEFVTLAKAVADARHAALILDTLRASPREVL